MTFLLAALGFGRTVFQAVIAWLSRRSLAEIGCIALVIACSVLLLNLKAEQRHSRKVEQQLAKCADVQRRLIAQSKVQQKQVTKVIDHYVAVEKPVIRKEVQRIETAPLPGGCKTPQPVLEADV